MRSSYMSFTLYSGFILYNSRMRTTTRNTMAALADAGLDFFAVQDLETHLGLRPEQARNLAQRLQQQNLARRLQQNLYALVGPADWANRDVLPTNWYRTGAALAGTADYYLAYYTAMELHRMTQQPLRTVFMALTRQKPKIVAANVTFRFVRIKKERFFGFEEAEVEQGHRVNVADLERTFFDCVDRPELCGGLEEIARAFARRHRDLNVDRLLRYLVKLDQPFVTKRLGFLLELAGHGDIELMREMETLAARVKKYIPLNKRGPHDGPRDRRWKLIINADVHKLLNTLRT